MPVEAPRGAVWRRWALAGCCAALAGCAPGVPGTATPLGATGAASAAASSNASSSGESPTTAPSLHAGSGSVLYVVRPGEGESNGVAWVAPVDGAPVKLGPAIAAAWSGDGRLIHLVTQGAKCVPRLSTVTPSGTRVADVDVGLRSDDLAFAWSRDETHVVFARFHNGPPPRMCGSQGGTYPAEALLLDIVVMNTDGTHQRVLQSELRAQLPISWSPGGDSLAVALTRPPAETNRQQLETLALDGTALVFGPPKDGMTAPIWSPDGASIAVTLFADDGPRLATIARGGSAYHDLGDPRALDQGVAWAPDGASIAVTSEVEENGVLSVGALGIRSVDGASRHDLGVRDAQSFAAPSWSPDGQWLAYVRQEANAIGGFGAIVVIRPDGSDAHDLPGTAGASFIAWQPAD